MNRLNLDTMMQRIQDADVLRDVMTKLTVWLDHDLPVNPNTGITADISYPGEGQCHQEVWFPDIDTMFALADTLHILATDLRHRDQRAREESILEFGHADNTDNTDKP